MTARLIRNQEVSVWLTWIEGELEPPCPLDTDQQEVLVAFKEALLALKAEDDKRDSVLR